MYVVFLSVSVKTFQLEMSLFRLDVLFVQNVIIRNT